MVHRCRVVLLNMHRESRCLFKNFLRIYEGHQQIHTASKSCNEIKIQGYQFVRIDGNVGS